MRTFIGELIFRFKDDASAKAAQTASKIGGSMDQLERSMKRLNDMPWGGRFTAQLDKLGASASDIERLRLAWNRLHQDMKSRSLSKAAASAEIENFKISAIGQLAAARNLTNQHMRAMEKRARTFSNNLQMIMKPAMVAMGGYTGAYMVGVGARAGIIAASNEQRERARQHFAGLPQSEQAQIEKQSQDLATKYRIAQADAMELMRESRLAMPSAEAAFSVAEEMVQAYKMLGLSFGSEQAITGLRAFNKAMDNINVTENTTLYTEMLNSFVKAQQITGKDMDPEAFAQAVKYARTSGKVFSPAFLQNLLPFLIAESGGSDTGTQLRATFDNFVGGTASKAALVEQARLGLRGKNGLVDAEGFAKNPIQWVNDNIVPALNKDGVDMSSEVAIAQAVQKFASNRLARDFIQRAITQRSVYMRLSEMMQGAIGLSGASEVDAMDPFSALKGFKDAMSNLAAAVLPIETITSGLNSLSNSINVLQQAWREGDATAKLKIGGAAGVAAFGTWKIGTAVWGLITAGTNLNAAAAALEAAAVSLGGAGPAQGVGRGAAAAAGASGGWLSRLMSLRGIATVGMAAGGAYELWRQVKSGDTAYSRGKSWIPGPEDVLAWIAKTDREMSGTRGQSGPYAAAFRAVDEARRGRQFGLGGSTDTLPGKAADDVGLSSFVQSAEQAGQKVQDALSVTAKPVVDKSDLEATLAIVNQIKSGLNSLGAQISSAYHQAKQAQDAEIRRTVSDYGVAP